MPTSTTKFIRKQITLRGSGVLNSGGAIAANRCVKIDGTDHTKIGVCTAGTGASGDPATGVTEVAGAAAGDRVPLMMDGIIPITAGGTIVPGDELVTDSAGRVIARATTATVLFEVVGRALTAAATGELCMVQWGPYRVPGSNAS